MTYLVVGLFILSLIAGVVSWQVNKPAGKMGVVGQTLTAIGVKQREQSQHVQIRNLMVKVMKDQQKLMEDINDQEAFFRDTDKNLENLSETTSQISQDRNADILRLKENIDALKDKNRLAIERGRELIRYNQEQIKEREQLFANANLGNIDSQLIRDRINDFNNQIVESREEYLKQVSTQTQSMHEVIAALNDKVQATIDQVISAKNEQMNQRMAEMKIKTASMLSQLEERMVLLRDRVHDMKEKIEVNKERLRDMSNMKKQQLADARDLSLDRKQNIADRTHDQLERLKQQREFSKD